jgi:hypothetical protein
MNEAEARRNIEAGVEQVFDAAGHLDGVELTMMAAIWESEDSIARDAVWAKAKAHIRRTKRSDLLEAADDQIAQWIRSRSVIGSRYGLRLPPAPSGQIGRPLIDAAVAIIAADALDKSERDVLMRPLRNVAAKHGIRV